VNVAVLGRRVAWCLVISETETPRTNLFAAGWFGLTPGAAGGSARWTPVGGSACTAADPDDGTIATRRAETALAATQVDAVPIAPSLGQSTNRFGAMPIGRPPAGFLVFVGARPESLRLGILTRIPDGS
jgi:hypothetical protein